MTNNNIPETPAITAAPLLLKVEQAAELLSISKSLMWKLLWSGQLPSVKLGDKAVRVPRQALEDWIMRNQAAPTCQIAG